jgi:hypothetical protein
MFRLDSKIKSAECVNIMLLPLPEVRLHHLLSLTKLELNNSHPVFLTGGVSHKCSLDI